MEQVRTSPERVIVPQQGDHAGAMRLARIRMLHSLEELVQALKIIDKKEGGVLRNAAGKVFLSWKNLIGVLLGLSVEEIDKLLLLKSEEQRDYFWKSLLPYIPTGKLLKIVEELLKGTRWADKGLEYANRVALALHQFEYNGPSTDPEVSIYPDNATAARDILWLAGYILELVEKHVKPEMQEKGLWDPEHEELLRRAKALLRDIVGRG